MRRRLSENRFTINKETFKIIDSENIKWDILLIMNLRYNQAFDANYIPKSGA